MFQTIDVAYRFPIIIPPYWSLVIRCLAILEGNIVITICGSF